MNVLEGKLTGAEDIKIGIVAARFNEFIVSRLIGGALDGLKRHDVPCLLYTSDAADEL